MSAWREMKALLASSLVLASLTLYTVFLRGPALPAGLGVGLTLAFIALAAGREEWGASIASVSGSKAAVITALAMLTLLVLGMYPLGSGMGAEALMLASRFTALYVLSGVAVAMVLGVERTETFMMLAHPFSMALVVVFTLLYMSLGVDASTFMLIVLAALLLLSRRRLRDTRYKVSKGSLAVLLASIMLPLTYIVLTGSRLPFMAEDTQRDIYYSLRATLGYRKLSVLNPHWYIYTPLLHGLVEAAPLAIYPVLLLTGLQLVTLYFILLHYLEERAAAMAYALFLAGMSTPPLVSLLTGRSLYLPMVSAPHLPFAYARLVSRYKFYFLGVEASFILPALRRAGLAGLGKLVAAAALVLVAVIHPLSLAILVAVALAYASLRLCMDEGLRRVLGVMLVPSAVLAVLVLTPRLSGLLGSGPSTMLILLKISGVMEIHRRGIAGLAVVAAASIIPVLLGCRALKPGRGGMFPLYMIASLSLASLGLARTSYATYLSTALGFPWRLDPPPALLISTYAGAMLVAVAVRLLLGPSIIPRETLMFAASLGIAVSILMEAEYLYASYYAVRISQLAALLLAIYVSLLIARHRGDAGELGSILVAGLILVSALHPAIVVSGKASRKPAYSMDTYLALARMREVGHACIVTGSVTAPGLKASRKILPLISTTNQTAYPAILEGYCNASLLLFEAGGGGLSGFPDYLYTHGYAANVGGAFYEARWPLTSPCSSLRLVEEPWRSCSEMYDGLTKFWSRGITPTLVAPWDTNASCTAGEALMDAWGRDKMIASEINIHALRIIIRGDSARLVGGEMIPLGAQGLELVNATVTIRPANYTYYAVIEAGGRGLVIRNPFIEASGYRAVMKGVYLRPFYNAALIDVLVVEGGFINLWVLYTMAPATLHSSLVFSITGLDARSAAAPSKLFYLHAYLGEALRLAAATIMAAVLMLAASLALSRVRMH